MEKDSEDVLTRNVPSAEVRDAIANHQSPIECNWIASLGYPFQYRVNESALRDAGYVYLIMSDNWHARATP